MLARFIVALFLSSAILMSVNAKNLVSKSSIDDMTVYDILKDLFNSLDGPNWINNAGWNSNTDKCSWYGIECDEELNVISIYLSYNKLYGAIPISICKLTTLVNVGFWGNYIYGVIPLCIGELSSLESLSLGVNSLSGKFG